MRNFTIAVGFCLLVIVFNSCSKTAVGPKTTPVKTADTTTTVNPPPAAGLITISPATGIINSVVTITGKGFTADTTKNTVTFGGVTAVINSASATQLIVSVTGTVKVVSNGTNYATAGNFTVQALVNNGLLVMNETVLDKSGNMYSTDGATVYKYVNSALTYKYALPPYAGGVLGVSGPGIISSLQGYPGGITIDKQGNIYTAQDFVLASGTVFSGYFYTVQCQIDKITPAGVVSVLAGGYGTRQLNCVTAVVADTTGNVYAADFYSSQIKKIDPLGNVTVFAGSGIRGTNDGPAASAEFATLASITIDNSGNIYAGDYTSIRKISTQGTVSTLYNMIPGVPFNSTGYNIKLSQDVNFMQDGSLGSIPQIFYTPDGLFFINTMLPNPGIYMINQQGNTGEVATNNELWLAVLQL
jgi:hypothetical protein